MRRFLTGLAVLVMAACGDAESPLTPPGVHHDPALSFLAPGEGGVMPADAVRLTAVAGTPVTLAELTRVTLQGDYTAAGVGMRDIGSGTINLSLPAGATVMRAVLYWAVMDDVTSPALAQGVLNGTPITGTLIGTTTNPCWASGPIHTYRTPVAGLVVDGANSLSGFAAAGSPQLFEGASIVAIYGLPDAPTRTIVIQDGAVTTIGPPPTTTLFDFSPRVADGDGASSSWIVADGQQGLDNRIYVDGTLVADHVVNGAGPGTQYWDTENRDITSFIGAFDTDVEVGLESVGTDGPTDCITWVAQVVSAETAVPLPLTNVEFSGNVNVKSKGVVPVHLLSTQVASGDLVDFDATLVVGSSVTFGPGGASPFHGSGHLGDVDGDGDVDLTLHFKVPDTGLACGDTEVTLSGDLTSGDSFLVSLPVFMHGC